MAIALFGAAAGTNTIVQLDDPSVWTDEAAAMEVPYFVTAEINSGLTGGESRLRRIVQAMTITATTGITITPIANGAALTDQSEAFSLITPDGQEQRIEHFVASMATRHAVKVAVTTLAGATAFGEADVLFIPRRDTETR